MINCSNLTCFKKKKINQKLNYFAASVWRAFHLAAVAWQRCCSCWWSGWPAAIISSALLIGPVVNLAINNTYKNLRKHSCEICHNIDTQFNKMILIFNIMILIFNMMILIFNMMILIFNLMILIFNMMICISSIEVLLLIFKIII